MPSERIAHLIAEALAEGERQEDFEYMVDALTQMRKPYHPEASYEEVEEVAGWLTCIFLIPKPRRYINAMQRFRILFKGIADSPELKATFANSVLRAALTVGEQVQYLPSHYFSWDPILRLGNLQGADLQEADLREADLRGANLQGAFLFRTNLQGANLQEAFLRTAILRAASLQGANFQGANLQEASLQGAFLQEASLQEVRELTQEQLEQAVH
jgi:hypothetical protein